MDGLDTTLIGVTLQDDGVEVLIGAEADQRKGVSVAHSYFISFTSETFGQRARDAIEELKDLADDVHIGWKREPKLVTT